MPVVPEEMSELVIGKCLCLPLTRLAGLILLRTEPSSRGILNFNRC